MGQNVKFLPERSFRQWDCFASCRKDFPCPEVLPGRFFQSSRQENYSALFSLIAISSVRRLATP